MPAKTDLSGAFPRSVPSGGTSNAEGLSEAEKKKRTLTNLYNARPTWLDLAHKRLDEAVFAATAGSPI